MCRSIQYVQVHKYILKKTKRITEQNDFEGEVDREHLHTLVI